MATKQQTDEADSTEPVSIETTEDMASSETGDVIEAGNTTFYVIDVAPSLLGPSPVRVVSENGTTGELITGVFHTDTEDGGTMWKEDLPENTDDVSTDHLIAEYGDIHVVGYDIEAIPTHLPESVGDRNCPECDESPKGGVFLWKTTIGDIIHEVYRCRQNTDDDDTEDCDQIYVHSHEFLESEHAVLNLYSRDGTEYGTQISGVFERRETDDWNGGFAAMMNQDDSPKGVWTASEVANFINPKMNTSGEAERFGVSELGGGIGKYETRTRTYAPTWWDDSNSWDWNAKVQFVPVESAEDLHTITDD